MAGVQQINPSAVNRFRNFLYKTSSGFGRTGDLISLGLLQNELRKIRQISLLTARLTSDLKSIYFGGQGFKLRVARRITTRGAGLIGRAIIPQGLGIASRFANKKYGRFVSKQINQFYNRQARIEAYVDGKLLTKVAKQEIQRSQNLLRQYRQANSEYKRIKETVLDPHGVSITDYNPAKILFDIQAYMVGANMSPGSAPVDSGALVNSINNRGFTTNSTEGLAEGVLTVGSSEGNLGDTADLAPYWWKTVFGGKYDLRKFGIMKTNQWVSAQKKWWFGEAVMAGLHDNIPKKYIIQTSHHPNFSFTQRPLNSVNVQYLQPANPGWDSFELSGKNMTEQDKITLRAMGYTDV